MIDGLTPREREVVALVAEGQANKEIARALGVSPNTIHNQLRSACGRLDLVGKGSQRVLLAVAWVRWEMADDGAY